MREGTVGSITLTFVMDEDEWAKANDDEIEVFGEAAAQIADCVESYAKNLANEPSLRGKLKVVRTD